jgi:hypothetical protein
MSRPLRARSGVKRWQESDEVLQEQKDELRERRGVSPDLLHGSLLNFNVARHDATPVFDLIGMKEALHPNGGSVGQAFKLFASLRSLRIGTINAHNRILHELILSRAEGDRFGPTKILKSFSCYTIT